MSPADVAAAFEDAALGQVLACVILAVVVGVWVWGEWIVSAPDREQRQKGK